MIGRLPSWFNIVLLVVGLLLVGFVDWVTGYEINFPVFYMLLVSIAAWYLGFPAAVVFSGLGALTWFGADFLSGHVYNSQFHSVWNTAVRLSSYLLVGWLASVGRETLDRERQTSEALRRALSEIKVLETFLPICAQCKKIRNQEGTWQQFETYISQHSNTQFSHSYCPECAKRAMEEAGLFKPGAPDGDMQGR